MRTSCPKNPSPAPTWLCEALRRPARMAVWALLASTAAQAEIRESRACPTSDNTTSFCFANDPRPADGCRIGARGDWLDLTDRVEILSRHSGQISIDLKGAAEALQGQCVPFMRGNREGYVRLTVRNLNGPAAQDLRLRLHRPGGHDDLRLRVLDASRYLLGEQPPASRHATAGQPKVLELRGAGLDRLRLKIPPEPGRVEILSQSSERADVRLTFDRSGRVGLDDFLRFEGGDSERQTHEGWPSVTVRAAQAGNQAPPANAPAAAPAAPVAGGLVGSAGQRKANLLPVRLFPERPLLRKLNSGTTTMVPIVFCANVGNNQTADVPLPDFEWGVSATEAVRDPVVVRLVDGSNRVLRSETVGNLARGALQTFRNWNGRPASVRVVRVVSGPTLEAFGNAPGCYLPAGSTAVLDARPLVVQVDATQQVDEGTNGEADNELRVD